MRRRPFLAFLVAGASVVFATVVVGAGAAVASPSAGQVSAAAARTHWGSALLVPGLEALNKGYNADVTSASCWGAGGCQIAGYYTDRHRHKQAFVARESRGRWGRAAEVPGTGALNQGGNAQVTSVYCARTSVCVAVGTYTDKAGNSQWFTTNERNGRWTTATEAPYPALNNAVIGTVWCSTGGLCASGGWYTDASGNTQAWVRTETHGHWQPGLEVPGIAALNVTNSSYGDYVGTVTVACASAGNCAAGGQYTSSTYITDNGFPALQAFVATETNGTWGNAEEVPGTASLNSPGEDASGTAMACPSVGNCTLAGYYQPIDVYNCDPPSTPNNGPGPSPFYGCGGVFMANQRHGTWQPAGGSSVSDVYSLACPAAGDCVASGDEDIIDSQAEGGLIDETNGHLGAGFATTRTGNFPSVACASPGYCLTGGELRSSRPFVLAEWKGIWGKAVTPAGMPRSAAITAVSCPPGVVLCLVGGAETVGKGGVQGFVASQVR